MNMSGVFNRVSLLFSRNRCTFRPNTPKVLFASGIELSLYIAVIGWAGTTIARARTDDVTGQGSGYASIGEKAK